MKSFWTLLALLLSFQVSALDWILKDPCTGETFRRETLRIPQGDVGNITIKMLETYGLDFKGDEAGINSIMGTPTGDAALEVLSDTKMRAYGWCYHVDGNEPGVMPNKYPVTHETKTITWFFAYSLYDSGNWVTQCVPAHTVDTNLGCH